MLDRLARKIVRARSLRRICLGQYRRPVVAVLCTLVVAGCDGGASSRAPGAEPVRGAAQQNDPGASLHERLLVLDTHLDTPARLEWPGFDILERHDSFADYSQVDLPRMLEGGLDGGFWVIFTEQGELTDTAYRQARNAALLRAVTIREMVAGHPDEFELATSAADARRIAADGKRVVFQSIENSYPLGQDLSLLETFYELGVRMVGPVHSTNNQFADSSTDEADPVFNGLSPLGEELVAQANRLGMIVDASHAHDLAFDRMLELSATPLILSHSGPKAMFDHLRNVDDERLKKLAASGGVIQMNALGEYLADVGTPEERSPAFDDFYDKHGPMRELDAAGFESYLAERAELERRYPRGRASFEDYMKHFIHVLELIGPDHVGVGADWDGGGGVDGLVDVAHLPRITGRLLAEGYTEEDLAKIWGGNVLRLLDTAERYAATLR